MNSVKTWKANKGVFLYSSARLPQARGSQKREAPGICPVCQMVNSALPGGQTFLSEKHLKKFANAYSISENYLKHEIPLTKYLLRKQAQLHTSLGQFFSSERLSHRTLVYLQLKRYEMKWEIDWDEFVNEFVFRHDNRRMKLHWVWCCYKFWCRLCRDVCEKHIVHCLFVWIFFSFFLE